MMNPAGEWLQGFGHGRSRCDIDLQDGRVIIGAIGQCVAGDFATVQHMNPFNWIWWAILDWDDKVGELSVDLKPIRQHIIVCLIMEDLFFEVYDMLPVFCL